MNTDKEGLKRVAEKTDSDGYCILPNFMRENVDYWVKRGWISSVSIGDKYKVIITDKGRNYALTA